VAKPIKTGAGKARTREIRQGGGSKPGAPAFPNQGMPSNEVADKQAKLIFLAGMGISTLVLFGGLFWCVALFVSAIRVAPVNILGIIAAVVGVVAMFFVARACVWMSIFAALIFAQKHGAWVATQDLCRRAMKLKKLIPGGATTGALLLIHGHISRGELDETIQIGQQQYEEFGKDPKQAQNLAPMYSTMGLAFHMQGQWRDSLTWNERAVEAFEQTLDQFKNRRGFMAKLAGIQGAEVQGNIHQQLAATYYTNATNHFNLRNHRGAKEAYRKAMEHANQSPDFPEKADLMRVSREQMQRLKHS
jgi:hypothetical protein